MQGEISGGFLSKNYSKHNFPISACKIHWSKDNGWNSGFCPLLALQENDVVQGGPTDFELPCGEEMISRKFEGFKLKDSSGKKVLGSNFLAPSWFRRYNKLVELNNSMPLLA